MKKIQFAVYEFPFRDRAFDTREEAEKYIQDHKPGVRDGCWIEEESVECDCK